MTEIDSLRNQISELSRRIRDNDVSDIDPETLELARQAVEAQENDKRTDDEKIRDGVCFIMGNDWTTTERNRFVSEFNQEHGLTDPEDFGKSPPFGPEPEILPETTAAGQAPEDEQDYDPDDPDGNLKVDLAVLEDLDMDQSTDDVVAQALLAMPEEARENIRKRVEADFQRRVEESRAAHITFVQKHRGKDAEVKFADAQDGRTYFVSFLLTNPKKQHNIAIPPINMSGKVETVRPGRLYACSGAEARVLERVLATKKLEILNISPKADGLVVSMNWIIENWTRLFPSIRVKPRDAFAKYRDDAVNEGDDLKTVAVEPEPEKFVSADTVQTHYQPQGEQQ